MSLDVTISILKIDKE